MICNAAYCSNAEKVGVLRATDLTLEAPVKQKKTKLALSTETIRTLSKELSDEQLQVVAGGTLTTKGITRCIISTGDTCPG